MRNPEYFWKDGQVVNHDFVGVGYKIPTLLEYGLVGCLTVDTNCAPGGWGRIDQYAYTNQSTRDVTWKKGTYDDLPAEFKTALLLLGVQP